MKGNELIATNFGGGGSYLRRRLAARVMSGLTILATGAALVPLVSILAYVLIRGGSALNLDFFTHLPKPVGEIGGGMANAILGTLILVGLASLMAVPGGVLAGIYLAEYRDRKLAGTIRFTADVLTGVPSISIGIFVYTLIVLWMRHFSAFAGGVALAIIMVPTVTRTTEEMLRMVPDSLREAALALGIPRWRTIISVVIPAGLGGIVTGIMLAVARAAGETAPLLFTAFNNAFWPAGFGQPIASLPVQIFSYAIAPYEDWHAQAWAGAFVLIAGVLSMNILARVFTRRPYHSR